MFRLPVDFRRPVETTDVTPQEATRVTTRLLRFIEYDSGVNVVVPQNTIWWLQWGRIRSVHANQGLLVSRLFRENGPLIQELWRTHCPLIGAGMTQELYIAPGLDSFNDPTVQDNTYLAYRPILSPLMSGDELTFIETGHALGDYVEAHIIVNEVTV